VQEVVRICSKAIHEQDDISNELAFSVLRVGGQLLDELRPLPVARKTPKHPNTALPSPITQNTAKPSPFDL
jgi:hypothetical protein